MYKQQKTSSKKTASKTFDDWFLRNNYPIFVDRYDKSYVRQLCEMAFHKGRQFEKSKHGAVGLSAVICDNPES